MRLSLRKKGREKKRRLRVGRWIVRVRWQWGWGKVGPVRFAGPFIVEYRP